MPPHQLAPPPPPLPPSRTQYHFNKYGWPSRRFFPTPVTDEDKNKLVDELQVGPGAWSNPFYTVHPSI